MTEVTEEMAAIEASRRNIATLAGTERFWLERRLPDGSWGIELRERRPPAAPTRFGWISRLLGSAVDYDSTATDTEDDDSRLVEGPVRIDGPGSTV